MIFIGWSIQEKFIVNVMMAWTLQMDKHYKQHAYIAFSECLMLMQKIQRWQSAISFGLKPLLDN